MAVTVDRRIAGAAFAALAIVASAAVGGRLADADRALPQWDALAAHEPAHGHGGLPSEPP